jgi:hypothetical protein
MTKKPETITRGFRFTRAELAKLNRAARLMKKRTLSAYVVPALLERADADIATAKKDES